MRRVYNLRRIHNIIPADTFDEELQDRSDLGESGFFRYDMVTMVVPTKKAGFLKRAIICTSNARKNYALLRQRHQRRQSSSLSLTLTLTVEENYFAQAFSPGPTLPKRPRRTRSRHKRPHASRLCSPSLSPPSLPPHGEPPCKGVVGSQCLPCIGSVAPRG